MSNYTVIGGNGFIGKKLCDYLVENGENIWSPARGDLDIYEKDLGIVFYCAGFGDCQNDPNNVLQANTILLKNILNNAKFSKLYYFSSTRLYMNQMSSNEDSDLKICTNDERRLFNLTKLVAEELCLKSKQQCHILRASNVYGVALESPLFLPAITRNAIKNKRIEMYITPGYEKDYISVDDVVHACYKISQATILIPKIINIASGTNTSAAEITKLLVKETSCEVVWHDNVNTGEEFPETKIDCLRKILDFKPRNVLEDIKSMVNEFRMHM
ncbi:NAD(P)-dependent oxidoreductase [uncultured Shewanella sp.]|uniref:NAD-dependent epimerase/dehydratase family protein n=1 Tax=uncultured Shewanella sp. TaxID=173975 RepID=UPI00261267C3|nr:NAD(P)-dependent oxidoreductase [uncultured Shewanella sp.]